MQFLIFTSEEYVEWEMFHFLNYVITKFSFTTYNYVHNLENKNVGTNYKTILYETFFQAFKLRNYRQK